MPARDTRPGETLTVGQPYDVDAPFYGDTVRILDRIGCEPTVAETGVQAVARMAARAREIAAERNEACVECGTPKGRPCPLYCPTMAHEDD